MSRLDTLFDQTTPTATAYLKAATKAIDAQFGEGYAEDNPQLIGAYMQAAALDFQAMSLHAALTDLRVEIATGYTRISNLIEEAHRTKLS